MQSKRKLEDQGFEKLLKSLKGENIVVEDELPRFFIMKLAWQIQEHRVKFSVPKDIPFNKYKEWLFEIKGSNDFEIRDSNNNIITTKHDNRWISNRYNVLSRQFALNASCSSDAVVNLIGRIDKLSPPIPENYIFGYAFRTRRHQDLNFKMEWRDKGQDNWDRMPLSSLEITSASQIIEVRRNECGIVSDPVELPAPWKTNIGVQFPLTLEGFIMENRLVARLARSRSRYLVTIEIQQENRSEKFTTFGYHVVSQPNWKPGIPFTVIATYKNSFKVKKKFHFLIPVVSNFNQNLWNELIGKPLDILSDGRKSGISSLPIATNTPLVNLQLNSQGYFVWKFDDFEIAGSFNIISVFSQHHFVIEVHPFPKSLKQITLDGSSVDTQPAIPFPLRNKDLLNVIISLLPNADRNVAKSVCKLWYQNITLMNTCEIHVENRETASWISKDIIKLGTNVFGMLDLWD